MRFLYNIFCGVCIIILLSSSSSFPALKAANAGGDGGVIPSLTTASAGVRGEGGIKDEYERYLIGFKKDVARLTDPKRLERFVDALEFIARMQGTITQTQHNFTAGLTEFSDWFQDEIEVAFPPLQPLPSTSFINVGTTRENLEMLKAALEASTSNTTEDGVPILRGSGDEDFSKSINWCTQNNPMGTSVISAVRNQGMCGACWAFVSASGIEASVRINGGNTEPLSVQELIDCDTTNNKGCSGGNPIYAYQYTVAKGLSAWEDYPYLETMNSKCMRSSVPPRVGIKGYIKVSSSNQEIMKMYLRYSPLSVGVCGTDQAFLYYTGGIYDPSNCCSTQNHALLLVGYGHDDSTGMDYWIALNSWGTRWGEGGFMRLKRTSDAGTGTCGVATNPSLVTGGYTMGTSSISGGGASSSKSISSDERYNAFVRWLKMTLAVTVIWCADNWVALSMWLSGLVLGLSLVMLTYSLFFDYCEGPITNHNHNGSCTVDDIGPGIVIGQYRDRDRNERLEVARAALLGPTYHTLSSSTSSSSFSSTSSPSRPSSVYANPHPRRALPSSPLAVVYNPLDASSFEPLIATRGTYPQLPQDRSPVPSPSAPSLLSLSPPSSPFQRQQRRGYGTINT